MTLLRLPAIAALVWALGAPAMAATPAGTAVGVNPDAAAEARTTRTLVVGADVAMGDRIVTGPTGQVQIVFTDDTHLVVGPASALVIESYLLRGDRSVGEVAISALGGSFRFITGKSDHNAYRISTPTGTIGVRGTAFDFIVDPKNPIIPNHQPGTAVALFNGAVELCDLNGKCVTLSRVCDLGGTSRADAFTVGRGAAIEAGVRNRFRYIRSQHPLLPPFRVAEASRCFLDTSPPDSLSTPSGGRDDPTVDPRQQTGPGHVP